MIILPIIFLISSSNGFRLTREIRSDNCDSQNGITCIKEQPGKFGRSFWISALNTLQEVGEINMQGEKSVSVGAEFQPSFCGQRPVYDMAPKQRIVGGKEAAKGQFPWQVQIWAKMASSAGSQRFFECGGTLISHNIVVSAGHCFKSSNPDMYKVALGKHFIGPNNPECQEQIMDVVRIEVHPRFNSRVLSNDVTLLWIKSPYNQTASFNDLVLPACLPGMESDSADFYTPGTVGTVSGWGLLNETGIQGSQTLQHVNVPILSEEVCKKAYGQMVSLDTSLQFCAGNDQGQDACSGDSGGPFVTMVNGRATLIGVVSFGKGCARSEYPGVYVKIHSYLPWILSKIHDQSTNVESYIPATSPSSISTSTSTTTTTTVTTTVRTTTTMSTTTTRKEPTTQATSGGIVPSLSSLLLDGLDSYASGVEAPASNVQVVGPVCKNSFKLLSCNGAQTLNIVKAFYGRQPSQDYCSENIFNQFQNSASLGIKPCSLEMAEIYLKYLCDGRTSCWIYNELFVLDPCPGIPKYSFVYYTCQ